MLLTLEREIFTEQSTVGSLSLDGAFECFTLEDVVREGPKVYGKTAIPYGRYEIAINYSNRFRRLMPLLLRVPGFEGIRIHCGNTAEDTEGCILVGSYREEDYVGNSRAAYAILFPKLSRAVMMEKIWIEVKRANISGTGEAA